MIGEYAFEDQNFLLLHVRDEVVSSGLNPRKFLTLSTKDNPFFFSYFESSLKRPIDKDMNDYDIFYNILIKYLNKCVLVYEMIYENLTTFAL